MLLCLNVYADVQLQRMLATPPQEPRSVLLLTLVTAPTPPSSLLPRLTVAMPMLSLPLTSKTSTTVLPTTSTSSLASFALSSPAAAMLPRTLLMLVMMLRLLPTVCQARLLLMHSTMLLEFLLKNVKSDFK